MAFLRSISRCHSVSRKVSLVSFGCSNGRLKLSKIDKLFHQNGVNRWASTVAATTTQLPKKANVSSHKDDIPPTPQRDPLDVSFNDPHAAFKSKTTFELIRAYFVYTLCSSEYLVENNMKVNRFFAIFPTRKIPQMCLRYVTKTHRDKCFLSVFGLKINLE